ncbi:mannitol-1-phosphate 5-dehydrogenase [Brevibacillus fulvus]|uniref:Mannitol-1-phosphate 5-dehydrogenase n=1 Tax=Brevibacillus fulvus TaxID=1125967 RepID=A0A938XZ72_9BACL|nr:mannitol-1-phosphate 5-dehydrogenase [Brevibacillus fulvus]MBM7590390.1 mannitol-1-phosphate 5-dehydrogenase [Brevibacillus fulvus]
MKALHFGAGNIGRGLIGYLLQRSGFEVCFVDINQQVVGKLNQEQEYQIELLDDEHTVETISSITALHSSEEENVIDAIVYADIITTSVGVQHLSKIAPILAKGLRKRADKNKRKIDVIANENAIRASSLLKQEMEKCLSPHEMAEILTIAGFPNSAIDRQALSKKTADGEIPLVEPFYEWIIEQSGMVNTDLPKIKDAIYVEDLQPYLERKLYLVNMGHAATAYLGSLVGEETIQSALAHPQIEKFVKNTLEEAKHYLIHQFAMKPEELGEYINQFLKRFQNKHLHDAVTRVGRSPIRKLGFDERLVKPTRALYHLGYPVKNLTLAIAAALLFDYPVDEESLILQRYIRDNGVTQALIQFSYLTEQPLLESITADYLRLKLANRQEILALI